MADGGVGEAALIAAAAESAAAAGGTAAATAAAIAAAEAAATATAAGATAAAAAPEVAAAVAPSIALAAPEAAAIAAPEVAAEAAPAFFATTSDPLLGAAVEGGTVTDASLLGPTTAAADAPLATPSGVTVGTEAFGPPQDAGLLGNWWNTTTTGEKLSAGGKLLSGVSAASKAVQQPASPGPKKMITPGTTGKPQGGEQALAQIVDAMLKRRDTYQQGQLGGVPVVYRPRGLLG